MLINLLFNVRLSLMLSRAISSFHFCELTNQARGTFNMGPAPQNRVACQPQFFSSAHGQSCRLVPYTQMTVHTDFDIDLFTCPFALAYSPTSML